MKIVMTILVLCLVVVVKCTTAPEPEIPDVTRFIEFRFVPSDTVSVGESVRVYAIVEDSLNEDITYKWSFRGMKTNPSPSNYVDIEIIPTDTLREFTASVVIKNEKVFSNSVLKSFKLHIEY